MDHSPAQRGAGRGRRARRPGPGRRAPRPEPGRGQRWRKAELLAVAAAALAHGGLSTSKFQPDLAAGHPGHRASGTVTVTLTPAAALYTGGRLPVPVPGLGPAGRKLPPAGPGPCSAGPRSARARAKQGRPPPARRRLRARAGPCVSGGGCHGAGGPRLPLLRVRRRATRARPPPVSRRPRLRRTDTDYWAVGPAAARSRTDLVHRVAGIASLELTRTVTACP